MCGRHIPKAIYGKTGKGINKRFPGGIRITVTGRIDVVFRQGAGARKKARK